MKSYAIEKNTCFATFLPSGCVGLQSFFTIFGRGILFYRFDVCLMVGFEARGR